MAKNKKNIADWIIETGINLIKFQVDLFWFF